MNVSVRLQRTFAPDAETTSVRGIYLRCFHATNVRLSGQENTPIGASLLGVYANTVVRTSGVCL
mgnify:CR=1 FL=1